MSGHPLLPALLVLSPRSFHLLELFDLSGAKEDSVSVFGFPTVGVFAARECFVDPTLSGKILSIPAFQTASPPVLNAVGVCEIFGVWSVPRVRSHRPHHTGAALTCVEVIEAAGSPKKEEKTKEKQIPPSSVGHWLPILVSNCNVSNDSLRRLLLNRIATTTKKPEVSSSCY